MKFVKRTHGGNVFEQMMGKGGRKQKWSSNKIAAEKAAKIDKKRGEIGRKRNYRMENRKQETKKMFLGKFGEK